MFFPIVPSWFFGLTLLSKILLVDSPKNWKLFLGVNEMVDRHPIQGVSLPCAWSSRYYRLRMYYDSGQDKVVTVDE